VKLSQGLLSKNLQRQPNDVLKSLLKHERTEVRIAVAQVIGSKKLRWGDELIGLLRDSEDDVRQAGRKALVQISGIDHGPDADATFTEREAALERWRDWWSRQKQGSAGK
jgi:HEAT repeat protein